jgi:hypothetical protein
MRPELCCETILTGPFEISGGVLNFIATRRECLCMQIEGCNGIEINSLHLRGL